MSAGRRRWWAAAAAAMLLIAIGGWITLRLPDSARTVAAADPGPPGPVAATGSLDPVEPLAFPESLERQLAAADPDLDALAGWGAGWEIPVDAADGGSWGAGGPFPDVSDLDGETRRELLRWLKEQAS